MSSHRSGSDRRSRHSRRHDQTSMRDGQTPSADSNYSSLRGMPPSSGARHRQEDSLYGDNVDSQYVDAPSHQSWQPGSGDRSHPSQTYYAATADSTSSTNTMGRFHHPPSISMQHGQSQRTQASSSNRGWDGYPPSSGSRDSLTAYTGA